jgi:hypothetical protein
VFAMVSSATPIGSKATSSRKPSCDISGSLLAPALPPFAGLSLEQLRSLRRAFPAPLSRLARNLETDGAVGKHSDVSVGEERLTQIVARIERSIGKAESSAGIVTRPGPRGAQAHRSPKPV